MKYEVVVVGTSTRKRYYHREAFIDDSTQMIDSHMITNSLNILRSVKKIPSYNIIILRDFSYCRLLLDISLPHSVTHYSFLADTRSLLASCLLFFAFYFLECASKRSSNQIVYCISLRFVSS